MDITYAFKMYSSYIYNYAMKLTCHPDDALDIVQETFLKACENFENLKDEKAIKKWLRTICFHEFLAKIKKEKNKYIVSIDNWNILEREGVLLKDMKPIPEEEVIVEEEIKNLQNGCFYAMVRRLSINQRIVFSLIDMFGLDICYTAGVLGKSKGAIKGLLYRARMNIDSFFANHCSIIYEKNPCSCYAWVNFSGNRENMQKKVRSIVKGLNFEEKNYIYNEEVRKKIFYLYSNMPDRKPSQKWYDEVLKIIQNNLV